jgi:uncharacterized protein
MFPLSYELTRLCQYNYVHFTGFIIRVNVYFFAMEMVKLSVVFAAILILIKFKLNVGSSIFIGGLLLGFLFGESVSQIVNSVISGLTSWDTIRLVMVVCIISTLGALLKYLKMTDRLVSGIQNVSGSVKTSMVLIPALIGLMPMPGGALLSAPLVDAAAKGQTISNAKLAAINYWFRHLLEFCWPIYPGIILSSVILNVEITQISLWQMPLSLAMIAGGFIFLILPLKGLKDFDRDQTLKQSWLNIISGVWPILLVILITFAFGVDILISLWIVILLFFIITRPGLSHSLSAIKEGCAFSIVSLICGIMVFQTIIEDCGAAVLLANQIASWGVPDWLVLFLCCFTIGLIAGIVTAYVGIVYPILVTLMVTPEPNFANIIMAYGGGLIGVMVSPLHLCLILTTDYFKSSFSRVYPLVLGPAAFVTVVLMVMIAMGYGS